MDCIEKKNKKALVLTILIITVISIAFHFIYQYYCIKCVFHLPGLNHGVYVIKIDVFNNVTAEYGTRNIYDNFSPLLKLRDAGFGYSKGYCNISDNQEAFISDFRRLWDNKVFKTNEAAYNYNDVYIVEIKYKGEVIVDALNIEQDATQRYINGILELSPLKIQNTMGWFETTEKV
ncbi:MAG: hypothetical protein E7411_01690 [Ruminococcaceae bacterium]|nr:hypothetical protein [Oscillospiraceae bacterium]